MRVHVHDVQVPFWVRLLRKVCLHAGLVNALRRDVQDVLASLPVPQYVDQRLYIPAVVHAHAPEKCDDLREQSRREPRQAHMEA
ncbi:Uncharacterised protein [uncultured Butyricicoccus sp.]|nr:Uncharacterised protein [uncultured Butyricicoccus sp.]